MSQYQWEKKQVLIQEVRIMEEEEKDRDVMEQVRLESVRGFPVSVPRTHQDMKPYLKGIHLMLDSWIPHRDE